MTNVRITDLPDFDLENNLADGYLCIVDKSEEKYNRTRRITVGDLLYHASRIVKCQYCGQPTWRDKACKYCGGTPERETK